MVKQSSNTKSGNAVKSQKQTVMVGSGSLKSSSDNSAGVAKSWGSKNWLLAAFTLVFGSIGLYLLLSSKAGSIPDGTIFTGAELLNPQGVNIANQRYPAEVEKSKTGLITVVPTMTGDAKRIAYYSISENKIRVIDAETGLKLNEFEPSVNRKIQSVSYMQWNADGTKLVVQYQIDAGVMRAFVMNVDGTGLVDVPADLNLAIAGWLPDSSAFAYIKDYKQLCLLTLSTKSNDCRDLQGYAGYESMGGTIRARIAPNGSSLAVIYKRTTDTGTESKIYSTSVASNVLTELFLAPDGADVTALAWSPNSEKLAYATTVIGNADSTSLHVLSITDKANNLLVMASKPAFVGQLDWVIRPIDWQQATSN